MTAVDYGRLAHEAAEEHLRAIQEAEDSGGEYPEMAGPWDGCETCAIREILFAIWPIVFEAATDEVKRMAN